MAVRALSTCTWIMQNNRFDRWRVEEQERSYCELFAVCHIGGDTFCPPPYAQLVFLYCREPRQQPLYIARIIYIYVRTAACVTFYVVFLRGSLRGFLHPFGGALEAQVCTVRYVGVDFIARLRLDYWEGLVLWLSESFCYWLIGDLLCCGNDSLYRA